MEAFSKNVVHQADTHANLDKYDIYYELYVS